MMREKFNRLVCEESTDGFRRGIELFIEELNDDIERNEQLQECSIDDALDHLVMTGLSNR